MSPQFQNAQQIAKSLQWSETFKFNRKSKTFYQSLPPAGVQAVARAIAEAELRGRASAHRSRQLSRLRPSGALNGSVDHQGVVRIGKMAV